MKIILQLFLFAILITQIKCSREYEYRRPATIRKDLKVSFSLDTCTIPIDSNYVFHYKKYSAYKGIFVGYNSLSHSLDFFDLNKETALKKIYLAWEGPESIESRVNGIFLHTKDSIFISTETKIAIMSYEGKMIFTLPINGANVRKEIFSTHYLTGGNETNNLFFDASKNVLYAQALDVQEGQCSEDHYKAKALFKVDILAKSIDLIPFHYSKLYFKNYYGFLRDFQITLVGDRILGSFPVDPNIYSFNPANSELLSYGGESTLTTNNVDALPWSDCDNDDAKMRHYIENINYRKVIFDPYRKLFYRFHTGDGKSFNDNETYKTENDKDQILTVFNEAFEIIFEKKLTGRRYSLICAFAGPEGLYLSAPAGENSLRFQIFKIDSNE